MQKTKSAVLRKRLLFTMLATGILVMCVGFAILGGAAVQKLTEGESPTRPPEAQPLQPN